MKTKRKVTNSRIPTGVMFIVAAITMPQTVAIAQDERPGRRPASRTEADPPRRRDRPGFGPERMREGRRRGPDHPGGDDELAGRQVPAPRALAKGGQHGLREGVAHDGKRRGPSPFDGPPELRCVEATAREGHHAATVSEGVDGGELPGPVHERAAREEPLSARLLRDAMAMLLSAARRLFAEGRGSQPGHRRVHLGLG